MGGGRSRQSGELRLGAFALDEVLGRGGMGEVWGGVHLASGVPVAVKVVRVSEGEGRDFARAFGAEVQATARLHHPNIIHIFDYGEIGAAEAAQRGGVLAAGSPYLVMERAASGSLKELGMPRHWGEFRSIMLQVLDALAHAHARGVVHRDIKPGNLLVASEEGGVPLLKLSDFGIATALETSGSRVEGPAAGTPHFMSPEQIHGLWRDQGPWTDLYSVGCLAVQLLTGYPPFYKPGQAIMDVVRAHVYSPVPQVRPGIPTPEGVQGWLASLLAKTPRERLQRAADAAFHLLALGDPAWGGESEVEAETQPSSFKTATGRALPPMRVTLSLPSMGWSAAAAQRRGAATAPPLPSSWARPSEAPWSATLAGAGLGLFGVRPAPFVGRQAERDALWAALRRVAQTGQGEVVLLQGDGGVGKSRLVEWLTERAHEVGGATVLRATHTQMGARTDGVAHMLARFLQCAGLRREYVLDRVEVVLRDLDPSGQAREDAAALAELMAPALGHDDTGEFPRLRFANPEERHRVIERFVGRLARSRPVILWLDDLQWGADALALAQHLQRAQAEAPQPVLILGVAREEALAERPAEAQQVAGLLGLAGASSLRLGPLPPGEHRELVRALLGLEGGLAEEVASRTEGRPLFAIQLIGGWVQRGVLEPSAQGFQLRAGEVVQIPADLFEVLLGRLRGVVRGHRSPRGVEEALELAAALGQSVDEEDWRLACRRRGVHAPEGLVAELERQRLVERTEVGFAFTEGLIHEALERAAAEGRRRSGQHRVCAEVVRDRYGEESAASLQRIAAHLLLGGQAGEALDPLLRAARLHRGIGDYVQAQGVLQQATELLGHLRAAPTDARRGEVLLEFAMLALDVGEIQRAESYVQAAERVARSAPHREELAAVALQVRVRLAEARGELDAALECGERALDAWTQLGDMREVARCLLALGQVSRLRGEGEAGLRYGRSALALLERGPEDEVLAFALHGLGLALLAQGQLEEAEPALMRAVSLFQQIEHRAGLAQGLYALGSLAWRQRHGDEAEEYLTRAVKLAEATGFREAPLYRVELAAVMFGASRPLDALAALEQARREAVIAGAHGVLGVAHAGLAACAALLGEWRTFDQHVETALHLLDDSGWIQASLPAMMERAGDCALQAQRDAQAQRAYEIALLQYTALGWKAQVEIVATKVRATTPPGA